MQTLCEQMAEIKLPGQIKTPPKATVRAKPLSLNHLPSTRDGCLGAGSLEMAACQTESRWSTSGHQISLILELLNTDIHCEASNKRVNHYIYNPLTPQNKSKSLNLKMIKHTNTT